VISVTSTSPHVVAYNTGNSPWVSAGSNNPAQGQMRFVNNRVEVWDGASWVGMVDNFTVGMTPRADAALTWAIERQAQEKRWAELAKTHPAVADAMAARDQAEAALSMVAKLCGELET
jgi:hypothetical protein